MVALVEQARSFLTGTIARTFTTRLFVMALGMAVSVVAARALGPAGRGQFAAAVAFATLVSQFGNLGLHGANTYLVGMDRSRLPALLGNTVAVGLGWGGILGIATYVASLSPRIVEVEAELRLLTALTVPLLLTYMLIQNLAMGIDRFDLFNRAEIANVVTTFLIMAIVVSVSSLTPSVLLAATLSGPAIAGAFLLARLGKIGGMSSSLALFRRGLTTGWKPYALSVAGFAITRADLLIVKSRLGDEPAGYYSVALTLIGIFNTFPAIVGQVLFPKICATPILEERWRQMARACGWLLAIVIAGSVTVALIAEPLVRLLFGPSFIGAVPALRALLIGAVFMTVHVVVVQYLNGLGYPVAVVVMWVIAAILNWQLNLALVPKIGLMGAAWASGITYGLLAVGVVGIALAYSPRTARGRARLAAEMAR